LTLQTVQTRPNDVLPQPAEIGRRVLPIAVRVYLRRFFRRPPVNLRLRDSSPTAIDADVAYALQVGRAYIDYFAKEGVCLRGKTVLELGPGVNLGSALILACHGARPIIADRFPANWDQDYHPRFYRALRSRLAKEERVADLGPLDRLIERNDYADTVIRRIRRSAEDLRGIPQSSIDAVVSNAVLEHLFNLPAACREIARVSKPLAWGFHQVDFRDHRNFDRPLEYLLLGAAEFRRIFAARYGECGAQWRPFEVSKFFETAGFELVHFEANMFADQGYIGEFEPRLRRSESRYRDTPLAQLQILGGVFRLRRRPLYRVAGTTAR
jgi:SAM-dependent methyltransferase